MTTHAIAKLYHYTKHLNLCNAMHAASSGCSHSYLHGALVGKNGDPELAGCSFQVDNFQRLSHSLFMVENQLLVTTMSRTGHRMENHAVNCIGSSGVGRLSQSRP